MARAGDADPPFHVDDVPEQEWDLGELHAKRKRLGVHAGAHRLGIAVTTIPPGKRPTPAHSHADEEEIFYVLAGDGLSYQSSGRDVHTYRVGAGDVLVHHSNGPAHTLVAGEDGMQVLILAEGSRTNITYLPRTQQFFLGPRWLPPDSPSPFKADAELGPLELPEPTAERPPTIVSQRDLEVDEGGQGRFAWASRSGGAAAGAERLVFAHDEQPPGSLTNPRHWHTRAEECFYVETGSGIAHIGDEDYPLRPGSFFLRPPATGVPHNIEAGPDGLGLITMGDRVAGDVCVYPDSGKLAVRPGVFLPITDLKYFDGEPEADRPL